MYMRGLADDTVDVAPLDIPAEFYNPPADSSGAAFDFGAPLSIPGDTASSAPASFDFGAPIALPSAPSSPVAAPGSGAFNWSSLATSVINAYGAKKTAQAAQNNAQAMQTAAAARYPVAYRPPGYSPFPGGVAQGSAPMGSSTAKTVLILSAVGALAYSLLRK